MEEIVNEIHNEAHNVTLGEIKRILRLEDGFDDNFMALDFPACKAHHELKAPESPSRANAIGIAVCRNGETIINIDTQTFRLKKNTAVVILPKSIYKIESQTDTSGILFAVSTEFLKQLHYDFRMFLPVGLHMHKNPCFEMTENDVDIFIKYIDLARQLFATGEEQKIEIFRGLLGSFFSFLHGMLERQVDRSVKIYGDAYNNRNNRLFERFLELLMENFRSEHQISFYADKLCLTPKYLSTLIKQTSGKSVSTWIDDVLIMEAKTLLHFSDMSIQQIAYSLHFPTPSFFGTYFKRHTGMTPGNYRERQ